MRRSAMLAARPLFTARTTSSKAMYSFSAHGMKRRGASGLVSRDVWTLERQSSLGVSNGAFVMTAGRSHLPLTSMLSRRMFSSELPDHDVVGLPALSPTMEMGTITEWKVKEGEAFAAGDIVCMVETDKATVDFEAQDEAVLAKILVPAGTPDVPVGTPIMVLTDSTDNVAALKDFKPEGVTAAASPASPPPADVPPPEPTSAAPAAVAAPEPVAATTPTPPVASPSTGGRIAASPLAKKLAKEQGFELSAIAGTGPGGRIIAADVKEFVPAAAPAEVKTAAMPAPAVGRPSPSGEFVDYPLSEQALAIAQNLTVSKQTVPHYYLTVDLKLEKLLKVRESLNEGLPEEEQLSLNDMLLKAAAVASEKVPDVNASWMDTFVRQYNTFDVNVVVGVGDGLVAPVVRDIGRKGLKAISDEVKALASSAQAQELEPHEVATGTFTVTNLGVYGVKNFAPIVHMPQACSLAIGAAEERVIPNEDPDSEDIYQLETMLSATLSCDHRVVDGAVSSQWLAAFRGLVENPLTMLL